MVLFIPKIARADSAASSPTPSAPTVIIPAGATPEMTQFLQNRATLIANMALLTGQEANAAPTPQALAQFQQQNAALLAQQTQLAQTIAQQQASIPLPTPPPLQMPPHSTTQMQAFLTARDQFMRDQIAVINQHVSDAPTTRDAAIQQWNQQNIARIQQIQQLAQAASQQQSSTPLPVPPPLQMPPTASPQLQAFLTTRDQLLRSQIALINQHLTDDPATQQAALQKWQQQNATLIQQMQQRAQALANSN